MVWAWDGGEGGVGWCGQVSEVTAEAEGLAEMRARHELLIVDMHHKMVLPRPSRPASLTRRLYSPHVSNQSA